MSRSLVLMPESLAGLGLLVLVNHVVVDGALTKVLMVRLCRLWVVLLQVASTRVGRGELLLTH